MRDMATAKKQVQQMLETLSDDVSFEDIQYHIYVHQQVQRGLDDMNAGRVVSHEEAQQRLAKWTTK